MFLKLQKQVEDNTIDPYLSLLSPLPDMPHLAKNFKASFSNWFLKLKNERGSLAFLYTLRNKSSPQEMEIMRKLIPKNSDLKNKDRQDPISVLNISKEKVACHLEQCGLVGKYIYYVNSFYFDKFFLEEGHFPCFI